MDGNDGREIMYANSYRRKNGGPLEASRIAPGGLQEVCRSSRKNPDCQDCSGMLRDAKDAARDPQ